MLNFSLILLCGQSFMAIYQVLKSYTKSSKVKLSGNGEIFVESAGLTRLFFPLGTDTIELSNFTIIIARALN